MELIITSTIDKVEIFHQEVTDKGESGMNYTFDIALPDGIASGEYEYKLVDGEEVLSTGLISIGDLRAVGQYEKEVTYKQYERE